MSMSAEKLALAVQLIVKSNSAKASFNVPVTDHYSNVHEILLHETNANLINQLIAEGFSLSMCPKGLSVTHYSI